MAGDLSVAEDLVSETLVEAGKACRAMMGVAGFPPGSTPSCCIGGKNWRGAPAPVRWRWPWLPSFERDDLAARHENLPSPEPSPSENAAQNDTAARLRECVDRLPEKHRRVILLRFFEDASLQDIARVLGCSAGTVKSRLHHALDKLRKMKMNLAEMKGDKQT